MKPKTLSGVAAVAVALAVAASACSSGTTETTAPLFEAPAPMVDPEPEFAPPPRTSAPAPEDTDEGVEVTIAEIGVSIVVPRGWVETPDGAFGDGVSRIGVFAVETSTATEPELDGFAPLGPLQAGGFDWSLYMIDSDTQVTGLALTEIGDLTYGVTLLTPAELAEHQLDTVVIPALQAFEATPLPAPADPFGDIEIDKVDVAGHGMSYVAEGTGSATVVFEAGLGNGMTSWAAVFPAVAQHTRAFAYDRPGYGDSDLTDNSRDGATMVEELHQLLSATGHEPPYILVGHSLGGTLMELFARTYNDEVAGVVLVDSRHHEFSARCLARFDAKECDIPTDADLDGAPRPILEEWLGNEDTARQLGEAPAFPDVPLTVIVAGIAGGTPGYDELWRETQNDYADMVIGSRLVVAERSDHGIPAQQPEIVIDAIVELLGETG